MGSERLNVFGLKAMCGSKPHDNSCPAILSTFNLPKKKLHRRWPCCITQRSMGQILVLARSCLNSKRKKTKSCWFFHLHWGLGDKS